MCDIAWRSRSAVDSGRGWAQYPERLDGPTTMVPHIATDSASKIIISSTVISPHITTSNMTNSEMELLASSGNGAGGVCLLLEEQHLIHMDDEDVDALQASVVFGSQLIDQNSATPYSDATKVRVEQKMLYYDISGGALKDEVPK